MGFYLIDNPPARSQYRRPRRATERGVVVVHTAENAPDYVALDGGAEAVARFIRDRADAGSYHELADSDSSVPMVPDDAEAFGDGTGSNPWAWHLSVATRADAWPLAPQGWRDGAVEQAAQAAARYAHRLHARTGIVIPARRITRVESGAGASGFISHAERDPARRSDPGAEFPWAAFLARYAALTADLGNAPDQETDDMLTPEESEALHSINAAMGLALGALARLDTWRHVEQTDGADDSAEVARLVLAGLSAATLSEAQVATIVDAIEALPGPVADELDRRARERLG